MTVGILKTMAAKTWVCFVQMVARILGPRQGFLKDAADPQINGKRFAIIITSVVKPSTASLSYSRTRSAFTPAERTVQTLGTISSIRSHIPSANVILVEGGLQTRLLDDLVCAVDKYIYFGNSYIVRRACDSKNKSLGEAILILASLRYLPTADYYIKLSGRYYLTGDFDLKHWCSDGIAVHFLHWLTPAQISTRFYCIPAHMLAEWGWAIVKGIPWLIFGLPIECTLAMYLPRRNLCRVSALSAGGIAGTDGTNRNSV